MSGSRLAWALAGKALPRSPALAAGASAQGARALLLLSAAEHGGARAFSTAHASSRGAFGGLACWFLARGAAGEAGLEAAAGAQALARWRRPFATSAGADPSERERLAAAKEAEIVSEEGSGSGSGSSEGVKASEEPAAGKEQAGGPVDSSALLKLDADDQDSEMRLREKKWPHKIISIRRTAKITKAGVLNSFSAFIIVGNRKGLIGYGKGKSNDAKKAMERAYQNAMGNLIAVELFDGHTIYHDIEHRFKKTKVCLWAGKQGTGVLANELVSTICNLAGIQNLRAKVHGVHHKRNTVRAVFEALELVQSAEELQRARGADLRLW